MVDDQPLRGINYYRLKMMSTDGQFELSEIRRLDFRSSNQNVVALYPNPARNKTAIVFEKAPATSVTVKIYNSVGQIIRTHYLTGGRYVYDLDVSGMSQGIYHVVINSGSIDEHHKLMIE